MKKLLSLTLLSLFLVLAGCSQSPSTQNPDNPQPNTPDLNTTTDPNKPSEQENPEKLVTITSPDLEKPVTSPLTIKGEVPGYYFWEAVFPVRLEDANGNILAQGSAYADAEWMTEEKVPFTATLEFETPPTETGTLYLDRENASGLPEHEHSESFPVKFK